MNTKSLISLWNHTQQHSGTSGARVCAQVLLGLYNGGRFPMDITELRILDSDLRHAALKVIASDATHCEREVHDWLGLLSGAYMVSGVTWGERFEALSFEYNCFKRGRVGKRGDYAHVTRFVIEDNDQISGKTYSTMIVDDLYVQQSGRSEAREFKSTTYTDESTGVKRTFSDERSIHGMKVIEDASTPRGLINLIQGGEVVGTMKLVHDEQGKPLHMDCTIKLNAEQSAAVKAMCDTMPAEGELVEYSRDDLPNLFQQRNHTE